MALNGYIRTTEEHRGKKESDFFEISLMQTSCGGRKFVILIVQKKKEKKEEKEKVIFPIKIFIFYRLNSLPSALRFDVYRFN